MTVHTEALSMFHGFFDDAATFPPGLAPLETAVAAALARRHGTPAAGTVGPSVIKLEDVAAASRLARELGEGAAHALPLSVVVPPAAYDDALAAAAAAKPFWRLAALELKVGGAAEGMWPAEISNAVDAPVPVYVELAQEHLDAGALDVLAEGGLRLKYRTGGLVPGAFPTPDQLAWLVVGAVRRGIPFKLTAGLHRGMRYTDPATGFAHHGFLNIARAVDAARSGAGEAEAAAILMDESAGELADWAAATDGSWRESFLSFGTCNVDEPLESLRDLGIVDGLEDNR